MAELFGPSLATHLDTIFAEIARSQSIYGYPLNKVYRPDPDCDISVSFHGKPAATPLGPASGPHTQMVQNILLAFLGGSRIMELKTVQILDELDIPRPCIDARNIGFNVEWSQELTLDDSYNEYINAWILLKILEHEGIPGFPAGDPFYHTVFDMSVGYDLKGISSPRVTGWIQRMKDAGPAIGERLAALPPRYARFRDLDIDPHVSNTLTLSTFHGCPRDEIQGIVEYLVGELDLDVLVKMNPTLLGHQYVRKTLNEQMGYRHIKLDPHAFEADLQFTEGIAMLHRLRKFAAERGRRVGAKFTNTLVVKNHDNMFGEEEMYLSGQPLHVISMNTMLAVRRELGPEMPVSFSAGIDAKNFTDAVCCGMVPVTTCTDLLRKGGYTRQVRYLKNLEQAVKSAGFSKLDDLLRHRAGFRESADRGAAGLAFAQKLVPDLVDQPRYHHAANDKLPKKVGTRLDFFDCLTCNICLPVCPNAANISLPVGKQTVATCNYELQGGGLIAVEQDTLQLEKPAQIANLADFCNECGNCEVFCPEDGGPQILKPRFFSSRETWRRFNTYDGFCFPEPNDMLGRLDGVVYRLVQEDAGMRRFMAPGGEILLSQDDKPLEHHLDGDRLDMGPYYRMKLLFEGFQKENGYAAAHLNAVRPAGEN
ncbi:MAG: glutamate synthase [Acidobacteriota bacterium]|nr:glutamate synthase [Acidobacteriota bacterium]